MQETKEVTLPSGKKVVIRAYTTRGDDRQASEVLSEGVTAKTSKGREMEMEFSLSAVEDSQAKYVELLTQTIDGVPCTPAMIDDLKSEDYRALDDAVSEVTKSGPKPKKQS